MEEVILGMVIFLLGVMSTAALYTFIILPNVIEKLISKAKSLTEEAKDLLLNEIKDKL